MGFFNQCYGVDVAAIDRLSRQLLLQKPVPRVYLLDEIGKMECHSPAFVDVAQTILDGATPVVATVALWGGGLIGTVKQRGDAALLILDRSNRDRLPRDVLDWLERRGSQPRA